MPRRADRDGGEGAEGSGDGYSTATIVVVDDDASFRDLVSRLLRSWGYAVVGEAATVTEAVARVRELRPDSVLADIELPDSDGFELTGELLALPQAPRVVLISTDADPSNHDAAKDVGARGFVPKDALMSAQLRTLLAGG